MRVLDTARQSPFYSPAAYTSTQHVIGSQLTGKTYTLYPSSTLRK